jgi:hypothetical protein
VDDVNIYDPRDGIVYRHLDQRPDTYSAPVIGPPAAEAALTSNEVPDAKSGPRDARSHRPEGPAHRAHGAGGGRLPGGFRELRLEPRRLGGEPRDFDGHARDRFIYAPVAGVLRTRAQIAQRVRAGETVAAIGDEPLRAPLDGILRGLVHDGVPVEVGAKVLEVDPRGDVSKVTGLGVRPARIAAGVLAAMASRG